MSSSSRRWRTKKRIWYQPYFTFAGSKLRSFVFSKVFYSSCEVFSYRTAPWNLSLSKYWPSRWLVQIRLSVVRISNVRRDWSYQQTLIFRSWLPAAFISPKTIDTGCSAEYLLSHALACFWSSQCSASDQTIGSFVRQADRWRWFNFRGSCTCSEGYRQWGMWWGLALPKKLYLHHWRQIIGDDQRALELLAIPRHWLK